MRNRLAPALAGVMAGASVATGACGEPLADVRRAQGTASNFGTAEAFDAYFRRLPIRQHAGLAGAAHAKQAGLESSVSSAAGSSRWLHNGSILVLEVKGYSWQLFYEVPRAGIRKAGAEQGTLLLDGRAEGGVVAGVAYVFAGRCGSFPYKIAGRMKRDGRRVSGQSPTVDPSTCRVSGSRDDELVFDKIDAGE